MTPELKATMDGITPACAGKTHLAATLGNLETDHPRMRGEDAAWAWVRTCSVGSPPHARGRLHARPGDQGSDRITPACAGKTESRKLLRIHKRDHPRMRGEDDALGGLAMMIAGSPPHARGRLTFETSANNASRITPACAGKTLP